ncbi:MAG TPA: aldose epimerase family protein [Bacteroidales bacterium]|nr:aldose epimerase family protein [Bacteroidales bacterium]
MNIVKDLFGHADGKEVYLFTLTNSNNVKVKITNFGGIVTSVVTPDKNGAFDDIVAGFDNLEQYQSDHPYFGAICGRYANRIANGKFTIDNVEYQLPVNNGPNCLHGGIKGFDKRVWDVESLVGDDYTGVKLSYTSADMEEGFPGNVHVIVTYTLNENNDLKISYEAETDKKTQLNLTNHSYFNLSGFTENILKHKLKINAEKYTEVNDVQIPTGKLPQVKNSPFDFTKAKEIGKDIEEVGIGYDHNFVLSKPKGQLDIIAEAWHPGSGRFMEVLTTEPGVQFYSANYLDGSHTGKGKTYKKHDAFCLETQHFPDSPNQSDFPSTLLQSGEIYTQTTIYKFSVK